MIFALLAHVSALQTKQEEDDAIEAEYEVEDIVDEATEDYPEGEPEIVIVQPDPIIDVEEVPIPVEVPVDPIIEYEEVPIVVPAEPIVETVYEEVEPEVITEEVPV